MTNPARILAVWSALAGYAIFLVMVIAAALAWPGYDHLRQYISELGATGAPHGGLVSLFGLIIPGALLTVFCVTAFLALPRSLLSALAFALIALFAAGLFFGGVYPCDSGCITNPDSPSQMLHELLGLAGYVTAPLALAFAGIASKRWLGAEVLFPLGCIGAIVTAASLPLLAPEFELHGLAQRALEGSMALWILACAAYLARRRQAAAVFFLAKRPPALA